MCLSCIRKGGRVGLGVCRWRFVAVDSNATAHIIRVSATSKGKAIRKGLQVIRRKTEKIVEYDC